MKINDICLSPTTIMSAYEKVTAKRKNRRAAIMSGEKWEPQRKTSYVLYRQRQKFLSWLEAWVLNELVLEMSDG